MTGQLTGLMSVGVTVKISSDAPDSFTKFQQKEHTPATLDLCLCYDAISRLGNFSDSTVLQISVLNSY